MNLFQYFFREKRVIMPEEGEIIDMPPVYVPDRRRGIDSFNPMGCPYGFMTRYPQKMV